MDAPGDAIVVEGLVKRYGRGTLAVDGIDFGVPEGATVGLPPALLRGSVQWGEMGWAIGLNLIWMAAAMVVFARQFRAARVRGALISIGE